MTADRLLTIVVPGTTALLAVLVGTGWLRLAEPLHTAVAIVAPAAVPVVPPAPDGGGPSGRVGDEGSGAGPPFLRAVELLSGGLLADDLANEPGLLAVVLGGAPADGALAAAARRLFARMIDRPFPAAPDADALRTHLRRRFRIETTAQPGLRRISYRHADPRVARQVLVAAVRIADARLRRSAQEQAATLVAHLRDRLADGAVTSGHRAGLGALLEDRERRLLVLSADIPFAIEFVAGPTAGDRPDDPDPASVLALAAGGGFVAGLALLRLRRHDAA